MRVAPSPYPQAGAASVQAHPLDAIVGHIPSAPTPDVLAEVERAAKRIDQLHAEGRELHFSKDPRSSHRVIIEVRDLEGYALKTIPPSTALHIVAGGEL